MFMFKFVKRKLGGGELIEPQSAPPPGSDSDGFQI